MTKTNQELLSSLMKSNKERRTKLAIKAGFKTSEDYITYLKKMIATPVVTTAKKASKKKESKIKEVIKENLTDIVIAFDTTGSMRSYIDSVKLHVKELIPKLFSQNPNLKISIVAFGDYCDMDSITNNKFGKAYQVIDLTNNENDLIKFINSAKNTSGGDGDEFYELVIKKITEETTWRKGSNRSVLFIADDLPHKVGYKYGGKIHTIDWRVEAKNAASKGIIFDTLTITHNVTWYKELSSITGGVSLPFKNSAKTSQVMEAFSLSRGGSSTVEEFSSRAMSKEVTEDKEINAVYSMYKTVVKK